MKEIYTYLLHIHFSRMTVLINVSVNIKNEY